MYSVLPENINQCNSGQRRSFVRSWTPEAVKIAKGKVKDVQTLKAIELRAHSSSSLGENCMPYSSIIREDHVNSIASFHDSALPCPLATSPFFALPYRPF
jgi:hypothetical protein